VGLLDPRLLLGLLACEAVVAAAGRSRVQQVTAAVERPGRELEVLAHALERIEAERFHCPRLARLRSALDTGGTPTSKRVHALGRLVRRLDWRRNLIFAPIAAIVMWTTHLAYAIEAWRAAAAPLMPLWLDVAGEIEALCALAGYAYEHPADPFPEIVPGPLVYEGEALGHPLISESACVRNDVRLGDGVRLLVVSGSNMSGKTTLLRTVGINAVLALAGCPVRAARLRLSHVEVGACIRVQDSIQAGRSRFYAEILRLKQIVAMTDGSAPVLFLLDEILHGTNSHDRRIGAEGLVKGLLARRAAGLITTHDLALAEIARGLEPVAANVHFEDHLEAGRMAFDYKIRPGVVEKSNAIELMRAVGLDV
jgi:DNA mismatch repair ATPase MutS